LGGKEKRRVGRREIKVELRFDEIYRSGGCGKRYPRSITKGHGANISRHTVSDKIPKQKGERAIEAEKSRSNWSHTLFLYEHQWGGRGVRRSRFLMLGARCRLNEQKEKVHARGGGWSQQRRAGGKGLEPLFGKK